MQAKSHKHIYFEQLRGAGPEEEGLQLLELLKGWLHDAGFLHPFAVAHMELVARLGASTKTSFAGKVSDDHFDNLTGALAYKRVGPKGWGMLAGPKGWGPPAYKRLQRTTLGLAPVLSTDKNAACTPALPKNIGHSLLCEACPRVCACC